MTPLQPLLDRVIVEPIPEDEVTGGGVILPDVAQEKPQRGRVVAVGPGARNQQGETIPMPVEEGDVVLFSKYGGTEMRLHGEDVFILREPDLLAIEIG